MNKLVFGKTLKYLLNSSCWFLIVYSMNCFAQMGPVAKMSCIIFWWLGENNYRCRIGFKLNSYQELRESTYSARSFVSVITLIEKETVSLKIDAQRKRDFDENNITWSTETQSQVPAWRSSTRTSVCCEGAIITTSFSSLHLLIFVEAAWTLFFYNVYVHWE